MDHHDLEKPEFTKEEVRMVRKLHRCIHFRELGTAKCLIENLSQEKRRKLTRPIEKLGLKPAIFVAVDRNKVEFVKFLVTECNADVEERFSNKNTIERTGSSGMTPLGFAFVRYPSENFEFLLQVGADATKLLKDSNTILRACQYYSSKVVQLLAEKGADLNVLDEKGNSCLAKALSNRKRDVTLCQFLLDKGVDVNLENRDGETALHIAARLVRDGFSKLFLDSGVDVNWKNKHGDTALHVAARLGRCSLVKLLLERGADPLCKNNNGDDPLQLACLGRAERTMNVLLETASFRDVSRQIKAYQLVGANHLIRFNNMNMAVSRWEKAVELYSGDRIQTSPAKINTPLGVAVEATSSPEFEAIRLNPVALYKQAVVLLHKHLGDTHPDFFGAIDVSIAMCFVNGAYGGWWHLLIYCFQMARNSHVDLQTRRSQLRFISNEMIMLIGDFHKTYVKSWFNSSLIFKFMETIMQDLTKCTKLKDREPCKELILRLIFLFQWINVENQQKLKFMEVLRYAIKIIDRGYTSGRTTLMSAVDQYFRLYHIFHNSDVVTMVLDCGADVNERDQNGNNIVHFLHKRRQLCDADRLRQLAATFVDYGIHLDARNHEGMETTFCLQDLGIKVTPSINLMCIAARGIRRHEISLAGVLPKFLIDFVKMH